MVRTAWLRRCVRPRRLLVVFGGAIGIAVGSATPVWAHGIGGRSDLPVPLNFFIAGAASAVVISFIVLAAIWPTPRLQDGPLGRPVRVRGLGWILPTLKWLGVASLLLVLVDGAFGNDRGTTLSPVLVWVAFWLVLPYGVAVTGNLWLWVSPWRTLSRWINRSVPERFELGDRIGVWPATVAFIAFTWLELVSDDSGNPRTLAIAAVVYTLYILAMTAWLGVENGLASGGAFENYHIVISAIAPFGIERAPAGPGAASVIETAHVTWRGWLRALPVLPTRRGTRWFIIALIGTVTYDGLSQTEFWLNLFGRTASNGWFGTVALVGTVVVIGAAYHLASWAAARLSESQYTWRDIADKFIHTLHPIAFAYAFSHYFTLVLFEGQLAFSAISDPVGLGWDLFGTAGWRVQFFLSPTAVWWIQLAVIVAGHIAATVLAHDRALDMFGERVAVKTQYAMLTLMVVLTSLGLFILAG